jgi:hypothetical protein
MSMLTPTRERQCDLTETAVGRWVQAEVDGSAKLGATAADAEELTAEIAAFIAAEKQGDLTSPRRTNRARCFVPLTRRTSGFEIANELAYCIRSCSPGRGSRSNVLHHLIG